MDGFIKLMEWWMKCAEKGKINHQWSASEHMDEQTNGWKDGWMTFWIDVSSEISADKLYINKRAAYLFVLSEVNVSTASEDLLSFWFFCLWAEWVYSQNVNSCLFPLHHQSPFLCLVFVRSTSVCFYCLFVSFAFTNFMQITLQTPRQSYWDGVLVFVLLSLYELRRLNFSQRYSYIFQNCLLRKNVLQRVAASCSFLVLWQKDSSLLNFETKTCCLDWWFYFAATIVTWNIHLMQTTDFIKNCV